MDKNNDVLTVKADDVEVEVEELSEGTNSAFTLGCVQACYS
ncbi:hypothetical protein ACIO87_23215 [Streptomyces sp. NPDC087218]